MLSKVPYMYVTHGMGYIDSEGGGGGYRAVVRSLPPNPEVPRSITGLIEG